MEIVIPIAALVVLGYTIYRNVIRIPGGEPRAARDLHRLDCRWGGVPLLRPASPGGLASCSPLKRASAGWRK